MRLVTIGVYGFDGPAFFQRLAETGIDAFCDLRARRGVRGPEYAWANSARLQAALADLGIRYLHLRELAPTAAMMAAQHEADLHTIKRRRDRSVLSDAFVQAYRNAVLRHYRPEAFLAAVRPARAAALFCVEREPAACHRSLVAEHLAAALGLPVTHLVP